MFLLSFTSSAFISVLYFDALQFQLIIGFPIISSSSTVIFFSFSVMLVPFYTLQLKSSFCMCYRNDSGILTFVFMENYITFLFGNCYNFLNI